MALLIGYGSLYGQSAYFPVLVWNVLFLLTSNYVFHLLKCDNSSKSFSWHTSVMAHSEN